MSNNNTNTTPAVALQASIRNGFAHVQGAGIPVNRNYGVAIDVGLPQAVIDWVRDIFKDIAYGSMSTTEYVNRIKELGMKKSLADSDRADYLPAEGSFDEDGNILLLIRGPKALNTKEGVLLRISRDLIPELVKFIESNAVEPKAKPEVEGVELV